MMAEPIMMGLLILGIAVGCGFVLHPFISALLWAAILVFATWPAAEWVRRRTRLPRAAVAALMVVLTGLVLVLPVAVAVPGGAKDVQSLRESLENWLATVPPAPHWLGSVPLAGATLVDTWNGWATDLSSMALFFRPYLGLVAERGLSLLLSFAGGLAQLGVALFAAFFFWLSGEELAANLQALAKRVAGRYADHLIQATATTVRGAVYGILGTAILQGFLTTFGLAMAGVPRPVLLGTVAAFLAVLPIGAPLVWIPGGLWLLANGATGHGIFLLAYGVVVVSGIDHVVRPYFISRGARLPFLLTVLGVLGGVLAFGVLGIFLGPVLLGVGFTLAMEYIRLGADEPV